MANASTIITVVLEVSQGRIVSATGTARTTRPVDVSEEEDRYFIIRGRIGDNVTPRHVALIVDSFASGPAPDALDDIPLAGDVPVST